jgi:hypothetical protein
MIVPPRSRIARTAARQPWTTPQKLTSNSRRLSASDISVVRPYIPMPALFTQVSRPPNSAIARFATISRASASATSPTT